MTSLRYIDYDRPLQPGAWGGLVLTASPASKGFQVQVCDPMCLRLCAGARTFLWARIEEGYSCYETLRARSAESPGVLPPLPFSLVDEHAGDAVSGERAWAKTFAQLLAASTASPLDGGCWFLGPASPKEAEPVLSPKEVRQIVEQRSIGYVRWDFSHGLYPITLRALSPENSGRVKAWRKHARAETLPPILLYWVSGLDACVVLDGHDRLIAAALEGTSAPALRLQAVAEGERTQDPAVKSAVSEQVAKSLAAAEAARERPPGERLARPTRLLNVDDADRVLLNTFVPTLETRRTRAWPLPGGLARWQAEVTSELEAQLISLADTGLLDDLSAKRR